MLQTLWNAMITLKTTCNNMSTLIVPENGDSTQSISERSRLLSLKVNTERRNARPYCPFEDFKDATMVAHLHRHLQSFHQRELRISNLRPINLVVEEIEGSKEIATTERDLRKLHKEKDHT